MTRTGTDVEPTERASSTDATWASWRVGVIGAVFISVLVLPAGLTYYFVVLGPPETSQEQLTIGFLAMLPGLLMGGAGILVAALN